MLQRNFFFHFYKLPFSSTVQPLTGMVWINIIKGIENAWKQFPLNDDAREIVASFL